MSDSAEFVYKCTRFYDPSDEGGILWNDPSIAVRWPLQEGVDVLLSEKDKKNPCLKDFTSPFSI